MEIFIVTTGSHDEYGIAGAFTDKESAQALVAKLDANPDFPGQEPAVIEIWKGDTFIDVI